VKCFPKTQDTLSQNWTWRYVSRQYSSELLTDRIEEASLFNDAPVENIIKAYQLALRKYQREVEFVKVTVNSNTDIIDLDKDEYLEEKRRVALNKLNSDDIRALGLETLATYNKLKYHEGPDSLHAKS
jgi:hypothetical protein